MSKALLASVLFFAFSGSVLPEEGIVGDPTKSWVGEPYSELRAAWGKPKKVKRHGKEGKLIVYRLRLFGDDLVGSDSITWRDVGIGPSTPHPEGAAPGGRYPATGDIKHGGSPEVLATQKVKFYVDQRGIIFKQEASPLKWKKKR